MIVLRCLLFVWLLCVQTCHSQNLILNPSFEIGSTTLSYEGKLATSWQKECGQHVYIRSGNDAWGGLRTTAGSYYLGFQGKGACNGLMQTINITANAQVTITFSTACRPGYGLLRLDVFMDSTKLGEFGLSNSYFVSSQVIVQASNVSRAGVLRFQNTPTSCTDCTSFFDNFSAVTSCSIGYYLDGVRCTSCPDGKYGSAAGKASAEEACTSCVAAGSTTACEVCAAGWDGVTCAACAVGKFKIWQGNDVACTECTGWSGAYAGYADSAGQSSCTPCPAHASNCSPSDKGTCDAGYGGSTADGGCTACAIGKFKADVGNDISCTDCTGFSGINPGYADSAGQSSCTPCPDHASNCSATDKGTCDAGYGGTSLTNSCFWLSTGSIAGTTDCSSGAGGPSQCDSVGHYCAADSGMCQETLHGFYATGDGVAIACNEGYSTPALGSSGGFAPYYRFVASGYDPTLKTWTDSSGNSRNIPSSRIGGTPIVVTQAAGSNGVTKSFLAVSGGTSASVDINNPQMNSYTFCAVARYSGASKKRLFSIAAANWLTGFWSGKVGVALHDGAWLSHPDYASSNTNWHVLCDAGENFRWDGTRIWDPHF